MKDDASANILDDFTAYARTCLFIQPVEGGKLVRFRLNEIQLLIEDIIKDIKKRELPVRLIILKARREGISTWVAGRFYWKTATHFDRYAVLITHEPEATEFLFNMTRRFQRYIPALFKPAELHNNRKALELNRPKGLGLDSAVRVGTAGKADFGSGQLIHYLHLSEVAKWPARTSTELLTSVLQCVPDEPDTEIIFESTARGLGGEFYERFWNCRYGYDIHLDETGKAAFRMTVNESASKDNAYTRIFIPWYVFPGYHREPGEDFIATREEEELKALHSITNGHLRWRRWAVENRCAGQVESFKQEYPSHPREAFISANRSVFNTATVLALKESAPAHSGRYEVNLVSGQWEKRRDGRLVVWDEPQPGLHYLIAADVAEGIDRGDFSCAQVIEHLTGKQEAQWHGRMDPDQFAGILVALARRYNTAWLVPERNNHGLMVVTRIVESKYPKIYAETVVEPPSRPRKRYGWVTSRANKTLIVDNLISEVRDGTHGIRCAADFDEMLAFVQSEDGNLGAVHGMYDDRVMSMAIAKFVRLKLPLPQARLQTGRQERGLLAEGWT